MRTIGSTGELPSIKIDHKAIAKGMAEAAKIVARISDNMRKALANLKKEEPARG